MDAKLDLHMNEKQTVKKMKCPCCKKTVSVNGTTLLQQEDDLRAKNLDPWWSSRGAWAVEAANSGRLQWACKWCLQEGRALRGDPGKQQFCDYPPYFAYYDIDLPCTDCGETFVFSGKEQQYWYEHLKFWVQSRPKQCVDCRRKRRQKAAINRAKSVQKKT
jgi:hypothetical protein